MKTIALLASAVILMGCAGSGQINWNNARQLRQGMTEQQVTSLMGRPYSVTSKSDGTQVWVWVHANGLTGASSSVALPMKDGIAASDLKVPDSFR